MIWQKKHFVSIINQSIKIFKFRVRVLVKAPMYKKPSLKINAISNWFVLGVNIIVALFLTPFIINNIGQSGFGIWSLASSFVGFYGLLTMGIDSAIQRYIAKYTAERNNEKQNNIINTSLVYFASAGIVVIAFSYLLSGAIVSFFNVEQNSISAFENLIILLGLTAGISFPLGVFNAALAARERFIIVNISVLVGTVIRTSLIVWLLKNGYGVGEIAFGPLVATLISGIVSFFMYFHIFTDLRLNIKFIKW